MKPFFSPQVSEVFHHFLDHFRKAEVFPSDVVKEWKKKFSLAIKPGVDLPLVWPKFAVWILEDEKVGVLKSIKNAKAKMVVEKIASFYRRLIEGGQVMVVEWEVVAKEAWMVGKVLDREEYKAIDRKHKVGATVADIEAAKTEKREKMEDSTAVFMADILAQVMKGTNNPAEAAKDAVLIWLATDKNDSIYEELMVVFHEKKAESDKAHAFADNLAVMAGIPLGEVADAAAPAVIAAFITAKVKEQEKMAAWDTFNSANIQQTDRNRINWVLASEKLLEIVKNEK